MTEARLGGCGPVVVRAGPHLGGGPDFQTGSDPAGRSPWARFGHRQRPRGSSRFPDAARRARSAGNLRWLIRVERGKVVGGGQATCARPTTEQGGERFRLRWSIQEKRAEGGGCDLVNNATVTNRCQLYEHCACFQAGSRPCRIRQVSEDCQPGSAFGPELASARGLTSRPGRGTG
jgi:hypothetical protein